MRNINGVVSILEDVISDTGGVPAQLIRDIATVSKLRLVTLESRSLIDSNSVERHNCKTAG